MPYSLDEIDIAIVNSLKNDGRKSFRQISREIKISTPTVKSRYQRLVNIGLIISVAPIIDASKLEKKSMLELEGCQCHTETPNVNLSTDMSVKMSCNYCDGPIAAKPHVFTFANFERFFCCNSCKTLYKEKYKGRIESVIEKFKNKVKNNVTKSITSAASLFAIAVICLEHGIKHGLYSVPNLV